MLLDMHLTSVREVFVEQVKKVIENPDHSSKSPRSTVNGAECSLTASELRSQADMPST